MWISKKKFQQLQLDLEVAEAKSMERYKRLFDQGEEIDAINLKVQSLLGFSREQTDLIASQKKYIGELEALNLEAAKMVKFLTGSLEEALALLEKCAEEEGFPKVQTPPKIVLN